MTTHRRQGSPTGPRIYLDAPRTSAGTILTGTYDSRYDSRAPRASFSSVPSTSTSNGRNSTVYESQPVKKVYEVIPDSGSSRGHHVVRSRRDSAIDRRQPLNVLTKNVSPTREYFESPREVVSYREQPRLLPPGQSRGSAHHQRHNSATRAETARLFQQPGVPRIDREYHKRGPYVEKVATSRPVQSVTRYEEPTYEYTNPHEQFDRDFPPSAPTGSRARRESLTRRERPSSAIGSGFEKLPFRRESATPRQFHQVERDDRRSGFDSDPDRGPRHSSHRSNPSHHTPVLHQRDDGYSSSRDEIDRRALVPVSRDDDLAVAGSKSRYREALPKAERDRDRDRTRRDHDRDVDPRDRHERRMSKTRDREYDRERDRPREHERVENDDSRRQHRRRGTKDRDDSPERSGGLKGVATAALGGLVTAGVFGSQRKESDSDSEMKREHRRRHRHKSRDESQDGYREQEAADSRKDKRETRERRQDSSGSDTPEEASSRRRPQSRTRQRSTTTDGYTSEPDRRPPPMDIVQPQPEQAHPKDLILGRALQESPVSPEGRTSPGDGEDTRPRKVSIVEPLRDAKAEQKPKGILKPPRAVPFPEDPNPQREGVAPLKQAGKDGVPSGARWTKISRILVNPEALQRAHERFEERDDYVIVLRVMSREEIEKLAEKTREIRESREREWQKEVEERRRRRAERGDAESDNDDRPLAIEPPPTAPPQDLRSLVNQGQQQQQQQQQQHVPQEYAVPPQHQAPLWQGQPQWAGQAYQPQYNASGQSSERNSAERIPTPNDQEASTYSQNV